MPFSCGLLFPSCDQQRFILVNFNCSDCANLAPRRSRLFPYGTNSSSSSSLQSMGKISQLEALFRMPASKPLIEKIITLKASLHASLLQEGSEGCATVKEETEQLSKLLESQGWAIYNGSDCSQIILSSAFQHAIGDLSVIADLGYSSGKACLAEIDSVGGDGAPVDLRGVFVELVLFGHFLDDLVAEHVVAFVAEVAQEGGGEVVRRRGRPLLAAEELDVSVIFADQLGQLLTAELSAAESGISLKLLAGEVELVLGDDLFGSGQHYYYKARGMDEQDASDWSRAFSLILHSCCLVIISGNIC